MDTVIYEDAKLAVKKGVNWLDENHPDWFCCINLSQLDMSECKDCVIGQAVGDYSMTTREAVGTDDYKTATLWAVEHGFESPYIVIYQMASGEPGTYGYRELDTLWSEEVQRRLGGRD